MAAQPALSKTLLADWRLYQGPIHLSAVGSALLACAVHRGLFLRCADGCADGGLVAALGGYVGEQAIHILTSPLRASRSGRRWSRALRSPFARPTPSCSAPKWASSACTALPYRPAMQANSLTHFTSASLMLPSLAL